MYNWKFTTIYIYVFFLKNTLHGVLKPHSRFVYYYEMHFNRVRPLHTYETSQNKMIVFKLNHLEKITSTKIFLALGLYKMSGFLYVVIRCLYILLIVEYWCFAVVVVVVLCHVYVWFNLCVLLLFPCNWIC